MRAKNDWLKGSMLFKIAIISVFWFIFFFSSLYGLSQIISLIGVYHSPNTEKFPQKLWKIVKCNGALSLPIIFAINLLIQTSLSDADEKAGFFLSLPITALFLMVIRILSNPSRTLKPSCCQHYSDKTDKLNVIATHKERVLSFVYAFVISSVTILLLLFGYYYLMGMPFDRLEMPQLTRIEIIKCFVAYSFTLGLATLLGELVLKVWPPMIQNNIKN